MSRKQITTAVQVLLSAALIGWLVYKAAQGASGKDVDWTSGPVRWHYLLAGEVASLVALCLTMVRWYYLVRGLDIPFRMRDAFRLGFLGYMLNFVALGSVGGDLFRAVFIAREAKNHRAEAVATVLIDRVIGLYILFVIAACAVWINGLMGSSVTEIRAVSWLSWFSTIGGGIGLVILIIPGVTTGALSESLSKIPRIGPIAHKLLVAVRIYRNRPGVLLWTSVLSLAVHLLSTVGFYFLAAGLANDAPPLAEHFVIVPMALVAGALPLPMMGLGAVEATLDVLYRHVPAVVHPSTVEVLKICMVFRLVQIINALIGGVIWLFSRREVAEIMHEAEIEGPLEAIDEAMDESTFPRAAR